jgi:hypothetical protein
MSEQVQIAIDADKWRELMERLDQLIALFSAQYPTVVWNAPRIVHTPCTCAWRNSSPCPVHPLNPPYTVTVCSNGS